MGKFKEHSYDQKVLVTLWNKNSKFKLRIVPTSPKEGGITQEKWNHFWDGSKKVSPGIRIFR